MTNTKRNLARGGALSFVGSAVSSVLGFLLTIYLANTLGDAGVGVVLQAMSAFTIALAVSKFGMDSTSIWMIPRLKLSDARSIPGALVQMACIVLTAGTVAVIILELFAPRFWHDSPEVIEAIRAVAWFLPAGALMLLMVSVLRALGNVRTYVLLDNIALPSLRLPVVMLAVIVGGSTTLVSAAWAVPTVIVLALCLTVLSRYIAPFREGPRPPMDWVRTREIVKFALPRTASAGMEQAIVWLGVLLVGILAGSAAAGVYGGASRFVQAGLMIDSAIRVVVSPQFSSMLHLKDIKGVQNLYGIAAVWLVLFATPIYIVLAFFAPVALSLLGPDFQSGRSSLIVLCIGAIITFLAGNIHSVLLMSGRSGWAAFNKAVVLIITVVGSLVLIPWIGFLGAAVTWAISMAADAALAVIQVRTFVGVSMRLTEVLLPLGISLATFGLACTVACWVFGATWTGLIAAILVGGVTYVALCYTLRTRLNLDGLGQLVARH